MRQISKTCLQCRNLYITRDLRQKFCSRSCSVTCTNLTRSTKCKICGKITGSVQKHYCSKECRLVNKGHELVKYIQLWKDNKVEGHCKYGQINTKLRFYLIEQAGNKCTSCGFSGINPTTGRTILQIDHIDGNCLNSRPENLKVLCPNCHAMTSTYGSLNKNSKRIWKRNSYQLNKGCV